MRDPQDKKIAEAFEALADIALLIEADLDRENAQVDQNEGQQEARLDQKACTEPVFGQGQQGALKA